MTMDELCSYLEAKYPRHFICGKEDSNLILWGAADPNTAEVEPKLCSLLIGLEYDPNCRDLSNARAKLNDRYRTDPSFQGLLAFGKDFSQVSGLPFLVIAYPSLREEYNGRWEDSRSAFPEQDVPFLYKNFSDGAKSVPLSGAQLAEKLHGHLGVCPSHSGTTKGKNKRLADYFHMWSRDMLSSSIVKFDIDGFIVNHSTRKGVLIEIKRSSKPPIPNWKPNYDKPDYILQHKFAKKVQADFWLLHHEEGPCNEQTVISFFDIDDIDETKATDFLHGPVDLQMPLTGKNSLDKVITEFIKE